MKINNKAILPKGFKAAGVSAGIKKSGRPDLGLVFSKKACKAAALFTTNKIKAAHIQVCRRHLKKSRIFNALIINSGNANCFTGAKGIYAAEEVTRWVAKTLNLKKEQVLIASTGIIGKSLNLNKIKRAIPFLIKSLRESGLTQVTKAIMTTDTFPKILAKKINIAGRKVSICGFTKGAGMISPNMATMLCFILTDAYISQRALELALKTAVESSFNCITVDGCMSTNDTIIVLANGLADNAIIDKDKNFHSFAAALNTICLELAKMIVRDAEGATKFIQIKVNRAKSFAEARKIALSIANSNLFKAAMYGENPNFGRIVASVGASGVDVKEKDLKIKVSTLNKKEIEVQVDINRGNSSAVVFTSDLTPDYIKINAEYN